MSAGTSARRMSFILFGVLAAMIVLLVGGSVFAASLLTREATDATHAQIDATVSDGDASRLDGLKKYLADNAAGISQTAALTAGLGQYDQTSIVATINGYASKAGITVTGFDFGTGTGAAAPAAAGVTAGNTINLTVASPLPYAKFIVFLRLVEQGLMPAQVTSAQVTPDSQVPGSVGISSLTVKVGT